MRMNWRGVALWTCGVLLFFALAPEALAQEQLVVPNPWAPAAVFAVMLFTAARERR
jgi:hypothetical protein